MDIFSIPPRSIFRITIDINPMICERILRNLKDAFISRQWVSIRSYQQNFEVKKGGISIVSFC